MGSPARQWLAKLAVVGGGPTFRKAGRTPNMRREILTNGHSAGSGPRGGRSRTSSSRRALAIWERQSMANRRPNHCRLKQRRTYTVEELATQLSVHKNT